MAALIPDSLDFSLYLRETNARVKVRRASAFLDAMLAAFDQGNEVRHPAMSSTKLRSRIEFRPAEVTVWAGYSGHRKSMFAGQLALDLMAQDQRVLIASFEMRPADTLARMARQAHGVARPIADDVQHFAWWTDDRLWIFDHIGRIGAPECIAVIRYFATELKGQHVFVDSMMMVCQSEERLDEQKQFATDLSRAAQELGIHIHLIAHCRKPSGASNGDEKPPTKYDLRGSAAISDQAHNVITVWANKAKKAALDAGNPTEDQLNEPDARVCIEKQRNGSHEGPVKLWFHEASLRFMDDRTSPVERYPLGDHSARV